LFTGMVEELGEVVNRQHSSKGAVLAIRGESVCSDLKLGDSVAVNGICLTVSKLGSAGVFHADVMPETLRRTNLHELQKGSRVNLERALRAGDRLGGHFVSGHIDATGEILSRQREGNAMLYRIGAPPPVLRYLVEKGSVTVDGISLTVVMVDNKSFIVSLIPHTAALTTLGYKNAGDRVNLETDMLAKYLDKLLAGFFPGHVVPQGGEEPAPEDGGKGKITMSMLQEKGFL
jgi:riboflavin synthase